MNLAKQHLDVGLFTNQLEAMLEFWQHEVGLPFEEMLPLGGGARQHRHGMNGSVLKVNHARDGVPEAAPAGYRELVIAQDGPARELRDPDGNRVRLVPPGTDGVVGIGVRMAVRSLDAARRHYGTALGWEELGAGTFRCGDTLLWLEEDPAAAEAGPMRAVGYRYLTVQVWDVDKEHAAALERGAREGSAPVTLGTTARISFLRDPDGNWLEVSQRASLTGALPG
ncbi:MAG: VOC family protein [Hyphomicrobiales bacterium]